jgi:FkbM family methyltransferase
MNQIRRRLQSGLLAAYELATRTRIIELSPVQRLYARLYFVYKRRVEARCISAVSAWITSGSVVVDVGAHVGFFTVEFARRVGESGTVLAFEPAQSNVELLRWNLRRFALNNVTVMEAALWERSGEGMLYLNPVHPGDHRTFPGDLVRPAKPTPLVSLDDFLETFPAPRPISLVKIDVQGAELRVLRGMVRTLDRYPDAVLLVEYTPSALTAAEDSPEGFLDFFSSRGYKPALFSESEGQFLPTAYECLRSMAAEDDYTDVLFMRASR